MAAGARGRLNVPRSGPLVVVVIGSEGTGKTALASSLAAQFDAPWSREYVPEYLDLKQAPLNQGDVYPIARGQLNGEQVAEDEAAANGSRIVVRDTDLVSTAVYSRHYYGACPEWIARAARQRAGDLYLLLCPDVSRVPDGLHRDRPDESSRAEMHALFRSALAPIGARVVEIRGTWSERLAQARAATTAMLRERGATP